MLSDIYAKNGLGYDRASQMVRLGTLERQGTVVALHSDLTMAPADPLFLAWIATNRLTMEGNLMGRKQNFITFCNLQFNSEKLPRTIVPQQIRSTKKTSIFQPCPFNLRCISLKLMPQFSLWTHGLF